MWIQVLALSCLLSFLEAQKMSPNFPECKVMGNAASQLKKNINFFLKEDAACQRNIHCTGVNCTWSDGGFLEVDLHHCDQVYYHIFINAPSKGIRNQDHRLKEGDSLKLYHNPLLGEISLKVDKLSRKDNVVTTIVGWKACLSAFSCTNQGKILDKTFCVKMESCPDFNASTTHYKPCRATPGPTGLPSGSSGSTEAEPGKKPSTGLPSGSSGSTGPHSEPGKKPSMGPHFEPEKRPTTEAPEPGSLDAHKGGKHKDDSSLSTAAIIGICAAGLIATLVVIGTVVYWKKYHHRSRLRAAYYNDISMHDPLYEDFGPEVA